MGLRSDDFLLRCDQYEQNRTSSLKSLWKNEDFLDVTIACDDDQVQAHKVVLSAASPVFRNILTRNPHSHPLLYLKGTTTKDIKSLLNFIYTGETRVVQDDLEEFMALADGFKIQGLLGELHGVDDKKYEEYDKKLGRKEIPKVTNFAKKTTKSTRKKSRKSEPESYSIEENDIPVEDSVVKEDAKVDAPSEARSKLIHKETEETDTEETEDGVLVVDLFEEIGEIEDDIADDMQECTGSECFEDGESFLSQNTSNTNITEYDEKIAELIEKADSGWSCKECPYKCLSGAHMREHAESHITGYSFDCDYCKKAFSKKRNLRHHTRRCKANNFLTVE